MREHGLAKLSLREAARRAGVSAAAPYFHFKSRDELLLAIAAEGFTRLGDAMEEAYARAVPAPVMRLAAIGRAYIDFARREPDYFTVMFSGRGELPLPQPERTFALLVHCCTEIARERGHPEPAAGFIAMAWGLVHGIAKLILEGPLRDGMPQWDLPADHLARAVTDQLVALLTPYTPAKRRR